MKLVLFLSISIFSYGISDAQNYRTLDKNNPIQFYDSVIIYQQDTIRLGPKAFFIDGQLTDAEITGNPYVYNSINEAAKHLSMGSEAAPMKIHIAPYVYWIDNPDDPEVRIPKNGGTPYGLEIDCPYLWLIGLNDNPGNVVLACNRGQTAGAAGNFTMFKISGDGIRSENITFGNYCNVDLEFPLMPALNRGKRVVPIVQAQLIHCNGDKILARNTHFISRLNLCNFVGAKRILFDRCHFESTDDALCGTGVYLNSTFVFFSPKPFYRTTGTGAVFLNCDIKSLSSGKQHFTKAGGQVALIDTRMDGPKVKKLSWQMVQPASMRNYRYNVSLNDAPVCIGAQTPENTVDLNNTTLLNAYLFKSADSTVYNTFNLLRGNDNWDPMNIAATVKLQEQQTGKNFSNIPVQLKIYNTPKTLETEKDSARLHVKAYRFGNTESNEQDIIWSVSSADSQYVQLLPNTDGSACTVIPTNETDNEHSVLITANSPIGLEAAQKLTVKPATLPTPGFATEPKLLKAKYGNIALEYTLDCDYIDESIVEWYRCSDKSGNNAVKTAVSRFHEPYRSYRLTPGDEGCYLMAVIAPKHQRSCVGEHRELISRKAVKAKDIIAESGVFESDFRNTALENQTKVLPGYWTLRPFYKDKLNTEQVWTYGKGFNGALHDTGLIQTHRVAEMFYTPADDAYSDMTLELDILPYKTAGQGFSVAHMYMDVLVNFDAENLSGYGLRLIRTTNYSNTVEAGFIKYNKGAVEKISQPVPISCYRGKVKLKLEMKDGMLFADLTSDKAYAHKTNPDIVKPELHIKMSIGKTPAGSSGIIYNGGAKTMIKHYKTTWN